MAVLDRRQGASKIRRCIPIRPAGGHGIAEQLSTMADHLIHKINYGFFEKKPIELTDLNSSKLLGVDAEILDSVATEVTEVMTNSVHLF